MACPCCGIQNCQKCNPYCINGCMPSQIAVSLDITQPPFTVTSSGLYTNAPAVSVSGTCILLLEYSPIYECFSWWTYNQNQGQAGLSISQDYRFASVQLWIGGASSDGVTLSVAVSLASSVQAILSSGCGTLNNPCNGYFSYTGGASNYGWVARGECLSALDISNTYCFRSGSASVSVQSSVGTVTIVDAYA